MDRGADLSGAGDLAEQQSRPVEPRQGIGSPTRDLRGDMSRVRLQLFPLAAERGQLQTFCDEWFNNLIPPEVAVFRPALPVVFCTLLHYAEMGTELVWRTGAMTQNELYFLIPLDRYRWRNGRLEFVEHCATTPYIFVDNAVSAVAGRERFGFPKQDGRFDVDATGGAGSDARRFASVSTWVPSLNGHRLAPLLEIVEEPAPWFGVTLDRSLGDPALTPRGGLLERFNLIWLLQTLVGEFRARTDPGPAAEIRGQLEELVASMRGGFGLSVYNLRQFAHPAARYGAHYQDLIRFRMTVGAVQEFRFLMNGLAPADYSVLLHKRAVVPIADRLGLTVWSRQRGALSEGRPTVDVLHTFFPAHAQADVALASTERLCWRFQESGWYDDAGNALTRPTGRWARYNDYLGPSAGAFLEPQPADPVLDLRYLMLPARAAAIREHLRALTPPECPIALEPIACGDYTAVRLVVSRSRPRPLEQQEELVWLDGNYASLSVPVAYRRGDEVGKALLLLHDFTDNSFQLQSLRELAGAPSDWGDFDTQAGDWLGATQDVFRVVRVDAIAIDRSANETLLTRSPLLDVFSVDAAAHDYALREDVTGPLRSELWELLSSIQPLLSFGAIPAPGNPERAVVRRLMRTEITQHALLDRREAQPGRALYAQLHHSETFPLEQRLGLVALPPQTPLALRLREGRPGRCGVVPVIAALEVAVQVKLAWMEILWQQLGHFERAPAEALGP